MAEQYDGDIKLAVTLDASTVKQSAEQLRAELQSIIDKMQEIPLNENLQKMADVLQDSVILSEQLTQQLDQVGQGLGQATQQQAQETQNLVNQVAESNNAMRENVTGATGALRNYADEEINVTRNAQIMRQRIENALSVAAQRTKATITRFKQLATQILRTGAAIVRSGLSKIGIHFGDASRGAETFTQKLKKGIRTVLAYGLGIQTIVSLFNKIRGAAKEAFNSMAQQIPEVNRDLSQIVSALQNLKNAIGTMFQPLLAAVTPLLTKLINMLTTVTTKIGEFFAAFTGQGYVYKATAANIDYAKSLEKTTKQKKKKNKEDQKELGAYDKLLVIQKKQKDKDNEPDGGLSNIDPSKGIYKKVPVSKGISDFVKRLKDTWNKNGDFTWLGELIANKIKEALKKIPWNYIKHIMAKLGKAIGETLNGIFKDMELARELGNAIAQLFNSALTFFYHLVEAVDFFQFGRWLGEVISSSLRNVDWKMLIDFAKMLGKKLADAIRGLLDTDVLYQIGNAIAKLLRAAIGFAFELIENFPFDELAQELIGMFKKFFQEMASIDETGLNGWQQLGKAISDGIIGLLKTINRVLSDEGLREQISQAIVDFLNQIDFVGILGQLEQLIVNIGQLLLLVIRSAFESDTFKAGLEEYGPKIALLIGGIFLFHLATFASQQLAIGFLRGLAQGLLESGGIATLTTALGSLAAVILAFFTSADIGKLIGYTLFPDDAELYEGYMGVTGTVKMIIDAVTLMLEEFDFDKYCNDMFEAFHLLGERIHEKIEKFKQEHTVMWNALKTAWTTGLNFIGNAFFGKFSSLLNFAKNVLGTIGQWISDIAAGLNAVQGIKARVTNSGGKKPFGAAKGAVIPPNNEFLAVLGDQKQGINIETPLATMVDAFKTAIHDMGGTGGGNQAPIMLQLDGRTVAQVVWDEQNRRYRQTGQYNPRMA